MPEGTDPAKDQCVKRPAQGRKDRQKIPEGVHRKFRPVQTDQDDACKGTGKSQKKLPSERRTVLKQKESQNTGKKGNRRDNDPYIRGEGIDQRRILQILI